MSYSSLTSILFLLAVFPLIQCDLSRSIALRVLDGLQNYRDFCGRRILNANYRSVLTQRPLVGKHEFVEILGLSKSLNVCESTLAPLTNGSFVIFHHNPNCYFTSQTFNVQNAGAAGAAIVVESEPYPNVQFDLDMAPITIPAILILPATQIAIESLSGPSRLALFAAEVSMSRRLDPTAALLLITAVGTMALGMWWGQNVFTEAMVQYTQSISIQDENEYRKKARSPGKMSSLRAKLETIEPITKLTLVGVLIGFVMVVGMLVLSFYFPKVIAPIIIAVYSLGALNAVTITLISVLRISPARSITSMELYAGSKNMPKIKVGHVLSFLISLVLIITFLAIRSDLNKVWPLQNLLGIAFCLVFIAYMRVQDLKIITVIMVMFFLYDIFFVFITPYIPFFNPTQTTTTTTLTTTRPTNLTTITSIPTNHTTITTTSTTTSLSSPTQSSTITTSRPPSVMESVALGLNAGGMLPIVFVYPYLLPTFTNPCQNKASGYHGILGLGDVLIPGIFGMYCSIYDSVRGYRRPPIYTIVFLVSYAIGLGLTFLALALTSMAQPALLYIVPCTLIAVYSTAIIRREVADIFFGQTLAEIIPTQTGKPRDQEYEGGKENELGPHLGG